MADKWINLALLEKALRSSYNNNNVTVTNYDIKPAVPVGENYTSEITRVHIYFKIGNSVKDEDISVIVKCQPRGNLVEKWTTDLNFFTTEIEMFSKTLPQLYKALGCQSASCFSSKCLYTTDVPNLILVLEDLKPQGYVMSPRTLGLNLDHSLMVIQKLASFHAASVVMVEKDPSSVKKYPNGIFTTDEVAAKWISGGFKSLITSINLIPGYEKYSKKLTAIVDTVITRAVQSGKKNIRGFNVLNHGDMWSNNMLFVYDKHNKPTDVKFVDFQLAKYSSPAIDLQYYYATSPSKDARDQLELLLDVYYGKLISSLTKLKHPLKNVPSRKQLIRDFEDRAFYGLTALAVVTPLVKASERTDATFEDLTTNDTPGCFREHCYSNECYLDIVKDLIPLYDSWGALD